MGVFEDWTHTVASMLNPDKDTLNQAQFQVEHGNNCE